MKVLEFPAESQSIAEIMNAVHQLFRKKGMEKDELLRILGG